jgi:hypothetical protein
LRLPAVNEQFDTGDVAGVIGGQKRYGLRNFVRCAGSTEGRDRGDVGRVFLDLLVARSQCRLGGGVDAEGGRTLIDTIEPLITMAPPARRLLMVESVIN